VTSPASPSSLSATSCIGQITCRTWSFPPQDYSGPRFQSQAFFLPRVWVPRNVFAHFVPAVLPSLCRLLPNWSAGPSGCDVHPGPRVPLNNLSKALFFRIIERAPLHYPIIVGAFRQAYGYLLSFCSEVRSGGSNGHRRLFFYVPPLPLAEAVLNEFSVPSLPSPLPPFISDPGSPCLLPFPTNKTQLHEREYCGAFLPCLAPDLLFSFPHLICRSGCSSVAHAQPALWTLAPVWPSVPKCQRFAQPLQSLCRYPDDRLFGRLSGPL